MARIVLARHGQASAHAEDYDVLSDLGRQQARLLGSAFSGLKLREPVVVTGTLKRQIDTARIIFGAGTEGDGEAGSAAEGAGAEVLRDERFNEYDHRRVMADYTPDMKPGEAGRLDRAMALWMADAQSDFPPFMRRVIAAYREFCDRLPEGRDGLIVSSGGVSAVIFAWLMAGRPEVFAGHALEAPSAESSTAGILDFGLEGHDFTQETGPAAFLDFGAGIPLDTVAGRRSGESGRGSAGGSALSAAETADAARAVREIEQVVLFNSEFVNASLGQTDGHRLITFNEHAHLGPPEEGRITPH